MDDMNPRCGWCNLSNPVYVAYHDAIGTTIVYAYLQSIGVINAHEPGCFLHRER